MVGSSIETDAISTWNPQGSSQGGAAPLSVNSGYLRVWSRVLFLKPQARPEDPALSSLELKPASSLGLLSFGARYLSLMCLCSFTVKWGQLQ